MFRCFVIALALFSAAGFGHAKPLITSSEETLARICLARAETTDRLISACSEALEESTLTDFQRNEILTSLGFAYLWNAQEDESEKTFRRVIEDDPTVIEAWNGLGWSLRTVEDDEAALTAFETSLALGVSTEGLSGKASTGYFTGALSGEEARQMLEAALAIQEDYDWALREIGWVHFNDGEFDEAEAIFRRAIEMAPDNPGGDYGLGRTALRLGNFDQALESFNAALEVDPNDVDYMFYQVYSLRRLDRNAQALRGAERFIEKHPDLSSGYVEKGLALMGLQRRAEAIQTYVEATEVLGPNNAIYYWHADALTYDGRMSEAFEIINNGIALEGADHTDHLLKSYIALELSNYPVARDAAEVSIEMGGDDPWAHYYIAISMVHLDETEAGLERFAKAMEFGLPEHRVGVFASELIAKGKFVEAIQLRIDY